MNTKRLLTCAAVIAASTFGATNAQDSEADNAMSFFITSVGSGDGANLGGLAGADAHCQNLAQAAGSRGKTWRAYLSAHATEEMAAIDARDRIGFGPWYNARGVEVASTLNALHCSQTLLERCPPYTVKMEVARRLASRSRPF